MKKILTLGALLLTVHLLPSKALGTTWYDYTIVKDLGYGEILITDGNYYYHTSYSSDCLFTALDEEEALYMDSFLPSYGSNIYYEDYYGTQTCTVSNSPDALDFTAYTLDFDLGNHGILVSRNGKSYIVDTTYDCYFHSTDEGSTIYIDSLLQPQYGDAVYLPGTSSEFCSVSNFPGQLNLSPLEFSELDSINRSITASQNGTNYSIQYGYGCTFTYLNSYNDDLYINSSDGTLDANDTLYHFHFYGYDSCSISDITNINTAGTSTIANETTTTLRSPKKPINLKAKKRKKRKATLQWKRRNAASYYKLQLKKKKKKIKTFRNVTSRKKKVGRLYLKPGKTYRFRVKACNSAGCSRWSDYKKFKTNK